VLISFPMSVFVYHVTVLCNNVPVVYEIVYLKVKGIL